MESTNLKGKVLWLTGASSGIGEAFAEVAAEAGCILALTARREEALRTLADRLQASGAQVKIFPGDVSNLESMKKIAEQIQASLGPIDLLVANAGTHIPTDVSKFEVPQYEQIMDINFFGVLHSIAAVLPAMIERRQGQIVGVSSVAGYRALPGAAAYGASKAALTHFLDSIRFSLRQYGIRVTVVSPGFVRTPLTDKNDFPMPCLMEPRDAALAMFRGIAAGELEVHFPKRFSYFLKFLRIIPYRLYDALVMKFIVK